MCGGAGRDSDDNHITGCVKTDRRISSEVFMYGLYLETRPMHVCARDAVHVPGDGPGQHILRDTRRRMKPPRERNNSED